MTSKKNQIERLTKSMPLTQRFALRKLSVGVASVLLGTSIAMGLNGEIAHADTVTSEDATAASSPAASINGTSTGNVVSLSANSSAAAPAEGDQLKATTPVDETAYTVTNVKASSEVGNGTDHTGHTNLAFDLNIDLAHHDIQAGNYLDVSMGLPYTVTADQQERVLAYGGSATQTMPINVSYQMTTGQQQTAVIGYLRPNSTDQQSYAMSDTKMPVNDIHNVAWQTQQNDSGLGTNGNGGSNGTYQIIFNDELAKIKAQYGENNLSLARMHFNLTWHNITGFNLDEAPLDTRYFHLYSSTATAPAILVPQNDIKIGNQQFTSGLKIPVLAKGTAKDNFNQTILAESTGKYAVHTWYYDLQTNSWSCGDEPLRYPDYGEAVALANQNEAGITLGRNFTITVTRPAANDYVDYQFADDKAVSNDIQKNIIGNFEDYYLDPVSGADNTYVTRTMAYGKGPDVEVSSQDSADGLTRTYLIKLSGDYAGFKKDSGIGLLTWRPKELQGILPPKSITSPQDDPIISNGFYQGVTLQSQPLQEFLAQHPWHLTVTNEQGQDLYNQDAGYYLNAYVYRDDVNSNTGLLTGTVNNVENTQVKETIHYVYRDSGKQAAPTYTNTLGFVRINEDGNWQAWDPASDTFTQVAVPEVPGYHAVDSSNQPVTAVAAIRVQHDTPDIEMTIYYVADQQLLTYTVIDTDTQQALVNRAPLAEGISDEAISSATSKKYQDIIADYLAQGYYLVKADPLPASFDNDPAVDQNVTIYLAKKNRLRVEEHQVTRTITYYDRDTGQPIKIEGITDPVSQTVTFTRYAILNGADDQVVGYSLAQRQDENGNYVVEQTDGDQAWQQTAGAWSEVVNPLLTSYGYDLAENRAGRLQPTEPADQPTATTPDQKIEIFYPEKVITTTETTSTTRTINYRYANGPRAGEEAAPSQQQTAKFARKRQVNQVTGKVTVGKWSPASDSLAAVQSPIIKYYQASQTEIPAFGVVPGDPDQTVTVDYSTAPNAVTYTVIDETNGQVLVDHEALTSGFADEQLPVSATQAYQAVANHYRELGYQILSQQELPATFTHDDQNVVIRLLMKNSLQAEYQSTTRTITYYDRNTGKQIMIDHVTEPVTQEAHFVRQAIISGLDQQIIGYSLDGKQDANGNYVVEVAVDNADQAWQLASGGWPLAENPNLAEYGYGPAEDESGAVYPAVMAGQPTAMTPNQSIKVYYRERGITDEEHVQVRRTIYYRYANGPHEGEIAAPKHEQAVTFVRSKTTNMATGEVQSGPWHPVISGQDHFAAVASPIIPEYTADQPVVNAVAAVPGQAPLIVTVNYTTSPHLLTYSVIDDTTGLTLINHFRLGEGFAAEQLPVSISQNYNDIANHYEKLGYQLVSQEELPLVFADHDQNLLIHLKHGTKAVTDRQEVNEEIQYQFVDGGLAAPTYQAAPLVFQRTGTTDLVTNRTEWEQWTPATAYFTAVVSPKIAGYETATPQIDEQVVSAQSADLQFVVLYSRQPVNPHPDQPVTPDKPVTPDQPVTPDKPVTPDQPVTPDKPVIPDKPVTPDKPIEPEIPVSSVTSSNKDNPMPASDGPESQPPASSAVTDTPGSSVTPIPAGPISTVNSHATAVQTALSPTSEQVTRNSKQAAANNELPQTGNHQPSRWLVLLGAFLGLFGIHLGQKKRHN